jgi:geranylgeranyl diphosphate synthase, type I
VTTATTTNPPDDTSAQVHGLPRPQLETLLREVLGDRRREAAAIGPAVDAAAEELERYVLSGGKRTRPAFAWAGWLAAGGDPNHADAAVALQLCAALELVHANALVHDDVIDHSDTRRGAPTVHVRFAAEHRRDDWAGDPAGYGRAAAILIGDLAAYWADDLIIGAEFDPAARRRLAPVWAAMRTEVLGGQLLDIACEASRAESLDSAMRINHYKTASYTVERPLHLGAALAGADHALVTDLRALGTAVGLAFQLRDDLLGVFGNAEAMGKPAGNDLRAGKRSAVVVEAQRAGLSQELARVLGRRDATAEEVQAVIARLEGSGVRTRIEARIGVLVGEAGGALERTILTSTGRALLVGAVHALTDRQT